MTYDQDPITLIAAKILLCMILSRIILDSVSFSILCRILTHVWDLVSGYLNDGSVTQKHKISLFTEVSFLIDV